MPSSYKLLVPDRECASETFINYARQRSFSPVLQPVFSENRNWEQYPSSESNLPRHRRDLVRDIPILVSNDSPNESDSTRC